jgi:copper transport protein
VLVRRCSPRRRFRRPTLSSGVVRRRLARFVAVAGLAAVVVGVTAGPAAAHANLLSTSPTDGEVLDRAPRAVELRFDQAVRVTRGGIRVYDGRGAIVDVDDPRFPGGDHQRVRVALPSLEDGSYIVTWGVVSTDGHPVRASFTFQVGPEATVSDPQGLAQRLLARTGAPTEVGVAYGIVRVAVFAGLLALIGGASFLAFVDPRQRRRPLAARLLGAAWLVAFAGTVVGIGLEGAYVAGRPLVDAVDSQVLGDVLDARFGQVWVLRLVLLVLAIPLLVRLVRSPSDGAAPPGPRWWVPAGVVGAGLVLTPGLAGHAVTGIDRGLAVPADALHVGAAAAWLGGLLFLVALTLPRGAAATEPAAPLDGTVAALRRMSRVATVSVAVVVATGVFQSWRQVGSLDALRDSDFGRILLVKVGLVAVLVTFGAFSREELARLARAGEPDPDSVPDGWSERRPAITGGGATSVAGARTRMRRFVVAEVAVALAVVSASALLVNTPPGRAEVAGPVEFTMQSRHVWVDVLVSPGTVGYDDVHVTVLDGTGTLTNVVDFSVQLSFPDKEVAPITVALRRLGPSHYLVPSFHFPFAGDWLITARVQTGPFDVVTLSQTFPIR